MFSKQLRKLAIDNQLYPRTAGESGQSAGFHICGQVIAVCSPGFFLLPGIATQHAGPAVTLAYLLAGLMIVPALLSVAELSAAMPRAGGTYYYLDRTLGPLVGTVGGMGTWLTLVLKSAFALIFVR